MPLFINQAIYAADVLTHLNQIINNTGGLATTVVAGNPNVMQVTYAIPAGVTGVVQTRMNDLVNSTPTSNIFITGTDPVLTPGITARSGLTIPASASVTNIIYDITQANNTNYFVLDISLNHISFPTCVILFHELAHAFHIANNEPNHTTALNFPNAERLAQIDENTLRTLKVLNLRNINDNGGGTPFTGNNTNNRTTCLTPSGSGGGSCYIATVCYEDAYSPEVIVFKQFRDTVLLQYSLGRRFVHFYYTYSPRIAAYLRGKKTVNTVIKKLILNRLYNLIK